MDMDLDNGSVLGRPDALSRSRPLASPMGVGRALVALALLFFLLPAVASAAECTDTYTGPSEGAWGNAENWSAESAPAESDVACVGSGKTAVLTSGTHKVGIVQGEGAVSIEGSTLELISTGEASVLNTMTLKGWGFLSGPGTLEISKHLTWAGGELEAAMLGAGTTVIAPGATVSDIAKYNARLEERTFINEGIFVLEKGDLAEGSGAEFINKGTFTITTGSEGNLYEKPKGGKGPGTNLGINIKDYLP